MPPYIPAKPGDTRPPAPPSPPARRDASRTPEVPETPKPAAPRWEPPRPEQSKPAPTPEPETRPTDTATTADLANTDSTTATPTATDPVPARPTTTEPVTAEPATAEPVATEPVAAEPTSIPDRLDPTQSSTRVDLTEDHLFDPDFRGTAADHGAIANAITSTSRLARIRAEALAARDSNPSLAHLSDDAAITLRAYTGHDVFDSMNTAQRLGPHGKPEEFERARLQTRAIISAINEMPPVEAELVRAIDVDGDQDLARLIADQYVPGRTTVEPTAVSATIKDSPDARSKFGQDVEIHIHAKTARDIQTLSQNEGEREAVSRPGTQWYTHAKEVVQVRENGVTRLKTIIRVEEVLPGDPRYLDRAAAEREVADRRAANSANRETFANAAKSRISALLGGGDTTPEHRKPEQPEQPEPEPAQPEPSHITDRLGGYAGADPVDTGPHVEVGTPGGHDWSPLSRATNPPSEPAIHADTANANQSAGYLAERHPHLAGVNPHFHDPGAFERGYQTNCTRAVVASALRRLGIDAEAGPLRPEDMDTLGTLDHVQDRLGGDWQSHNGYDDVIRAMRDLPVDSRAVIAVKYLGPDGVEYGHVAEVVHTREGVAFVDPQTNSLMRLPHPPTKLDLLPYDPTEVARRNAADPGTAQSTSDSKTTADTTATAGYGAAEPPARGEDRPPPTREEINRYLQDPRVQEAMRTADAASHRDPDSRITVDGQQLHIGEAIAALLPRHPQLAALLRDVPFLENSLLARPQTLANLLRHPQAIEVLQECVTEVRGHPDPEALADRYEAEPAPGPAELTPEQAAVSDRARITAKTAPETDLLQDGFIEAHKDDPEYRNQYLDGLYRDWAVKQGRLHALADEVARASGGEAFSRKTEKSRARAADKIAEYGNNAAKLTDLVGSKIQYHTMADAYRGLEVLLNKLEADGSKITVVKFKDRFLNPQDSGYRDLQLNVRLELPDGTFHVAELRLHLVAIDDVADYEHALYEVRRDFAALAEEEGRTMSAEERALVASILSREKSLFDEAFRQGRGTVQDGDGQ